MARVLDHPSRCADCSRLMRAGEEADFFKNASGKWEHLHHPRCPPADEAPRDERPLRGQKVPELWDEDCADCGERYGGRGSRPPLLPFICHHCQDKAASAA